ncbi:MAG: HEAT repeat domain-containing protein, partial [Promethearchaeota archaeon]
KDKRATGILVQALNDPRYMIRIHVAAQLGERKDKTSVGSLIEALDDESLFVRQTVAGALENIGGKKATNAVRMAESKGMLLDELPEGIRL